MDFTPLQMVNQLRNAQNRYEQECKRLRGHSSPQKEAHHGGPAPSSHSTNAAVEVLASQRQPVREALEASCTAICVAGEEFVRAIEVESMLQVVCRIITSCDDDQTATLVLAFRALALVADTVPHANVVMAAPSRGNQVVPLLIQYMEKPHLLLSCDDLTEEILRCLSFIALVDCGAKVLFEYHALSHLLALECLFTDVAYLGQLCLETAHRIIALANPRAADELDPALIQLVQNMDDTISVTFQVPLSARLARATPKAAAAKADDVVIPRTTTTFLPPNKMARLRSYSLCLASAFERLAPVSPARHHNLLARAFSVCVRLAGFACRLRGDQRQSLVVLALSPIANLYVAQPVDMVPFLLESALLENVAQIALELLASPARAAAEAASSSSAPAGRASGNDALAAAAAAAAVATAANGSRPESGNSGSPRRNVRLDNTPRANVPSSRPGIEPSPRSPRPNASAPQDARATSTSMTRLSERYDSVAAAAAVAEDTDEEAMLLLSGSQLLASPVTPPRATTGRLLSNSDEGPLGGTGSVPRRNSPLALMDESGGGVGGDGDGTDDERAGANGNANAAANPNDAAAEASGGGGATFAALLLGHDTANLPFISEELCVLPLLELLLLLLPCTRRTPDSHFDHLNSTQPFFAWQWEDDFHNRNDCAEGLSRRLEREYQKKRNQVLKKDDHVIITHTTPRVLTVDYLGMYFTSPQGRSHRRLFRNAVVSGFSHKLLDGVGAGCQCGTCTDMNSKDTKSKKKDKKEKKSRRQHTSDSSGGNDAIGSSRGAVNPLAMPALAQPRLSSSTTHPGGVSFTSVSTPHASLHRVGSHRRAEAVVVADETSSVVNSGGPSLEQSQLVQVLFGPSHASPSRASFSLTESIHDPATFASAGASTTAAPGQTNRMALSPTRLGGGALPSRAALAVADTPLGAAASGAPRRQSEARVVSVRAHGEVPAMPETTPVTTTTATAAAAATSAGGADAPTAENAASASRAPLYISTSEAGSSASSTSSSPPESSADDDDAPVYNIPTPPASHRPDGPIRQADFGRRSPRLESPSMTRSQATATTAASDDSVNPDVPSRARQRRSGWSCCTTSDVATTPSGAGGRGDTVSASGASRGSARAVSVASGQHGTRSQPGSATSPYPRHGRGGRSAASLVLPASTAKEDRRLLQDLSEELLSSHTLRNCFLQEVAIRALLGQFLPRILAVIRNAVNPIVVRHASVLLLRCVSLACEWAEMEEPGRPSTSASGAQGRAKSSLPLSSLEEQSQSVTRDDLRTASMRKWSITNRGSSDSIRQQRAGQAAASGLMSPTRLLSASSSGSLVQRRNVLDGYTTITASALTLSANTATVRDAIAPSTGALASALVYLLSTNANDVQPLLGPTFPFRPLSEDARMLYTVMRMGLSVEFCAYVPTVRGEMRLAAADTVQHLVRLERRISAGFAVPAGVTTKLTPLPASSPSPHLVGAPVAVAKADGNNSTTTTTTSTVRPLDQLATCHTESWHLFTVAEERTISQLATGIINDIQSDAGTNLLVVGRGQPLMLVGADIVMEQAALAKRDSAPIERVANTVVDPSPDCTYHRTLASARLNLQHAFRSVVHSMDERRRQRALEAELPDGLGLCDSPSRLAESDQVKSVWEEIDAVPEEGLPTPDKTNTTAKHKAKGKGKAKLTTTTTTTTSTTTTATTPTTIRSAASQASGENAVVHVLPMDDATPTARGSRAGGVEAGDASARSATFPFASSLTLSPSIDLSEPNQLRSALESRMLTVQSEVPVRAACLAVALFHLLQETDLTMRVLVTKAPQVLNEVAQSLLRWALPRFRNREDRLATGGSLGAPSMMIAQDAGEEAAQVGLNLDTNTQLKLTQLTQELTFAVGERLGLAASTSRVASMTSTLPVRFAKRETKSKLSTTIADLTWTPIAIHLSRFVNEPKPSAQTPRRDADPALEASVPTTDESRCELHIGGYVLRYLPVELDKRALLVVCTSTVGALQSLIIRHAIAQYQPPPPEPLTRTAVNAKSTTAKNAHRRHSSSPILHSADDDVTHSASARTGRNATPTAAATAGSSSSSSSNSDDDEIAGSPTHPPRQAAHPRRRGTPVPAASFAPLWLPEPDGRGLTNHTTAAGTQTASTPAVLRSIESLDTPLFDATHGPFDGPTPAAPNSPTAVLSSSHTQAPHRRSSSGSDSGAAGNHTLRTTGDPMAAITQFRLLLLVDGIPLLCPMMSLVDALCYYAESGGSLRDYVDEDARDDDDESGQDEGTSAGAGGRASAAAAAATSLDENAAAMALRRLAFWVTVHRIQYVLLESPLPVELRKVLSKCGCRGGAPIIPDAPTFYCAPKHLFSMLHEIKCEPSDGALRLLYALTLAAREGTCSTVTSDASFDGLVHCSTKGSILTPETTLASSPSGHTLGCDGAEAFDTLSEPNSAVFREHRLRSALVHDLYGQLDTILLPPLMYRQLGECFDDSTVGTHLASYALWNYPLIFPFGMRLTLLELFLGARRTMSARVINGVSRFLRSSVGSRFLGFQWMNAGENGVTTNTTRVPVRVRRDKLLQDGAAVLRNYAFCPFPLDVHFRGEPGIGIGPALELFELMANALATPETGMWRTEVDANGRRVVSPLLFPSPYQTQRTLYHFETLGLLVGRLLVLRRPIAVRFHPLFLRRLLFRSSSMTVAEVTRAMALLDPEMEKTLSSLENMSPTDLEACELTFVLPSTEPNSPEIPLCNNGATLAVTAANVKTYTLAVRFYLLEYSLDIALQSFRVGLQYVLNPIYLTIFTVDEVSLVLSGATGKIWHSREAFRRDVSPQHGYTCSSPMIQYLVELVPSWTEAQQRAFLRFVTGSGTLPAGGLLDPIKVVRRDAGGTGGGATDGGTDDEASGFRDATLRTQASSESNTATRDDDVSVGTSGDNGGGLPTASTCFHYLKLPQYSSKAVLEARLLRAIEEGQSGFMLT